MRQTRELDDNKGYPDQIEVLKKQVQSLDSVIVSQQEVVRDLQSELKGPIKHHTIFYCFDDPNS